MGSLPSPSHRLQSICLPLQIHSHPAPSRAVPRAQWGWSVCEGLPLPSSPNRREASGCPSTEEREGPRSQENLVSPGRALRPWQRQGPPPPRPLPVALESSTALSTQSGRRSHRLPCPHSLGGGDRDPSPPPSTLCGPGVLTCPVHTVWAEEPGRLS